MHRAFAWLDVHIRCTERDGAGSTANFLPDLQRELIAVISKYVKVNPDDIRVSLEKQDRYEVLEVKIELPEKA